MNIDSPFLPLLLPGWAWVSMIIFGFVLAALTSFQVTRTHAKQQPGQACGHDIRRVVFGLKDKCGWPLVIDPDVRRQCEARLGPQVPRYAEMAKSGQALNVSAASTGL